MEHETARRVNANVKAVIWHLVMRFPHAAIVSRQVEGKDHLFTIMPYDGTPDKEIQIAQALLADRDLSVPDFATLLNRLDLPTVLHESDRYHLTCDNWTQAMPARTNPPGRGANAGNAHRHDARPASPLYEDFL